MTAQGIKAGEEHLYVLYVVVSSLGGYFWHEMGWSEDPDGGFWEPACNRSICSFKTREEAIRDMRREVPCLFDPFQFEEVPAADGEMLFRKKFKF